MVQRVAKMRNRTDRQTDRQMIDRSCHMATPCRCTVQHSDVKAVITSSHMPLSVGTHIPALPCVLLPPRPLIEPYRRRKEGKSKFSVKVGPTACLRSPRSRSKAERRGEKREE